MSGSTFTCMFCDIQMKEEEFGGAVAVPLKNLNDALIFVLCKACYHKSKRPSADKLCTRMPEILKSDLRHTCAFTTLNIIALNCDSLERALECGHEQIEMLQVMAQTDSFILFPC